MRHLRACLLAAVLLTARLAPVTGQSQVPSSSPTVGLALSGGSAKGLAHIGVLRVLQEYGIPVQVVTGTSMGAIIGGLYAVGYAPAELELVVLEVDWEALFANVGGSPEPPSADYRGGRHIVTLPMGPGGPTLPANLVSSQAVSQLLARLTWRAHGVRDFRLLSVPFAAVAADVETGEAVRLDSGFLPRAIQASMALPSIFDPVVIRGRTLVDGGVIRNLPAQDALDLGASVVICSDVSEPLLPADSIPTAISMLSQVMSFAGNKSNMEQRELCDALIHIQFDRGAGLEFSRAQDWIALGDSVARANISAILAVVDSSGVAERIPFDKTPDSIAVTAMRVSSSGERIDGKMIGAALGLGVPGVISAGSMDRALTRAYRSGRFRLIEYETDAVSGVTNGDSLLDTQRTLTVRAQRAVPSRFGFGFRYDSRYKASVLLSAMLNGAGHVLSDVHLDVRLGQQIRIAGDYLYRAKPGLAFAAGGGLGFTQAPFDVFDQRQLVGEFKFDVYEANGFAGLAFGPRLVAAVGLHGEHARWKTSIAPVALDTSATFFTIGGRIQGNWYGAEYFPRRGAALLAKSEFANSAFGSGGTFSHLVLDVGGHLPVHSRVSLMSRVTVGTSSGDDLPPYYAFTLGGANPQFIWPDRQFPFFGLATQELQGRHVQRFSVGMQVEPLHNVFTSLQWNTGTTYDEWDVDFDRYVNGYGLTLGAQTFLGGVALTLSEITLSKVPLLRLDFGSRF